MIKKVIFTKFQLTADIGIISSFDPRKLLTTAQIIYRQQQRSGSSQTGVVKMLVVDDVRKAINKTISQAGEEDLILVTGSLYLVGEVKKFLISND